MEAVFHGKGNCSDAKIKLNNKLSGVANNCLLHDFNKRFGAF